MSTAIGISGKLHAPLPERRAGWRSPTAGEASPPGRVTDFATDAEERLGGRVFHVRSNAHEQLQRRIEALGRRARRIRLEPVRLIDTGERDDGGHALVVLSGRAPVLARGTLAAIVEHRDGRAAVRPAGEQDARLAREMSFVYGLALIPRDEHAPRQLRGSRYFVEPSADRLANTGPRAHRAARLGLARAGDRSLTADADDRNRREKCNETGPDRVKLDPSRRRERNQPARRADPRRRSS